MSPIRVVELFAGVGSQRMALEAEGIPHEVVAIAEIDRHALASYEAIHGDCPNLGDITKVGTLPDCDLVTYSFPCQDLSLAGKRKGMGEGTRSGLVWEVMRILEAMDGRRPEWLLMENVPQVLTSPLWPDLLRRLEAMGYRNRYAKLDSSRFGSAQKRVRAFMVSRLERNPPEIPDHEEGAPSLCIRDVMEPSVPERYVKRIPLERVRWREPPKGYANPQSDGIVCPLIDSTVPRLEDRRIAAERSLSPTLRRGQGLSVVSEEEEERARSVCDRADNLRMAPRGESSIGTMRDGDLRTVVSPEERRRREARGEASSTPVAENLDESFYSGRMLYSSSSSSPTVRTFHGRSCQIKVLDKVEPPGSPGSSTPCAEVDGVVYYPERSLYSSSSSSSPTVCTDHGNNRIQVVDKIEPTIETVAEDTSKAYGASAKILSSSSSSPTLRSQAHGLQNQPKVLDGTVGGDLVVRVLTPRECWRLMGFSDEDYDKAAEVSSETQLYNQAGNSIVVEVLRAIFRSMFVDAKEPPQTDLTRWL